MADIKWIKLSTDIFNNRKVKIIEKMPDGDSLIVIWIKLLCLAGTVNDSGLVYLTKDVPYTDEMLSVAFDRPLQTIRLALSTFEKFGMIEIVNDILMLPSWEKYQSVDALDKVREQARLRKQRQRSNQQAIASHVTCHADVTQCHATELELELELDKENTPKPPKGDKRFDRFWAAYPKKVGKGAARKAFSKVKTPVDVLISAVDSQKQSEQWQKNKGQFIPNPATWLNQGRWDDEMEPSGKLFKYDDRYEEGESL